MDNRPIGVLDSGVGGLTIWKEILRELPNESTVYIGDSKNAPYGKRSPEEIRFLASKLIQFLLKRQAKLIVIACNTITVNGIDMIREAFPKVPIIGTVPVVKMAAAVTKNKKIGLLVTGATAKSAYNQNLINTFASDCDITIVGTNKLVPLIETGDSAALPGTIAQEIAAFKKNHVDVVILGSTHFPILRKQIQDFMGEDVIVLDSGGAVARQTKRILSNNKALTRTKKFDHALFTTGETDTFVTILRQIIGNNQHKVEQAMLQ